MQTVSHTQANPIAFTQQLPVPASPLPSLLFPVFSPGYPVRRTYSTSSTISITPKFITAATFSRDP